LFCDLLGPASWSRGKRAPEPALNALLQKISSDDFFHGQYKGRLITVHSNQSGEEKDETVQHYPASPMLRGERNHHPEAVYPATRIPAPPFAPRPLMESATGSAARRQSGGNYRGPSGGALDTVPVLLVFLGTIRAYFSTIYACKCVELLIPFLRLTR
jgi:hypothetical protein